MKSLEQEKIILDTITEIYLKFLIILFPFIVNKTGFFNILECKWHTYLIISTIYLCSIIIIFLYYKFIKKTKLLKHTKLTIIHYILLIYLIVNIISCFLSPFFKNYNLFVGTGRGEGLIMVLLYGLTFLAISLFAKFKQKYFLYFSIGSIIVGMVGLLQYLGYNPLNLYQSGIGIYNVSFLTTIGNVDFVSAFYCIYLPISFYSYIFLEKENKKNKVIHFISIILGTFIIGFIDVQSGKLALISTLILVIPFIITNSKRLSRLFSALSGILLSFLINVLISSKYYYDIKAFKLEFDFDYLTLIYIIMITILILISLYIKKKDFNYSNNKKIIRNLYLILLFFALISLIFIYFYNFKNGFFYEIHELLHGNFNDEFGTYRIFLWKRTLKIFPEYSLVGSGPDTFAIRFMDKYTKDIAAIGPLTINDTAANVYLTILINTGLLGLFSYLIFIINQLKRGIKEANKTSIIFLISIICFLIQDFFNLTIVIVTPIFWALMGLHISSLEYKEKSLQKILK